MTRCHYRCPNVARTLGAEIEIKPCEREIDLWLRKSSCNSSRLSTCDLDGTRIRAEDQFETASAMEGGEELEKAIKELPRDKEVVQLYQKPGGADPQPAR